MRDYTIPQAARVFRVGTLLATLALGASLAGCSSSKPAAPAAPAAKHYALAGSVVSIDKAQNQVTVDAGDIPGFMPAMTMPYGVKDPKSLDALAPGDQITADVVVAGNDINLDKLAVVKKAEQPSAAPPSTPHPAPANPPKH